jgi:hypothetical protein
MIHSCDVSSKAHPALIDNCEIVSVVLGHPWTAGTTGGSMGPETVPAREASWLQPAPADRIRTIPPGLYNTGGTVKLRRRTTHQPAVPDRYDTRTPPGPAIGLPAITVVIIVIISTATLVALGRPAMVALEVVVAAGIGAVEILRQLAADPVARRHG